MLASLPAGVVAWLEEGIDVCVVGCELVQLVERFPRSRFVGELRGGAMFDLVLAHDTTSLRAIRRTLRRGAVCLTTVPPPPARARDAGFWLKRLTLDLYALVPDR